MSPSLCSTGTLDLAGLVDSIFMPDTYAYEWDTDGDGIFQNTVNVTDVSYNTATTYVPGVNDIANGGATLSLTSTSATTPDGCMPTMDILRITILQVDCGMFPWSGN